MFHTDETLLHSMAHELRQPLSTIELIAYYLELAIPHEDPRMREQVARLRQLVEQSSWILSDTLALTECPKQHFEAVDLDELISEFVLDAAQQDFAQPDFQLSLHGMPVWMDYLQARQMVRGVCRLFRATAKPESTIDIATRVLPCGNVQLRIAALGPSAEESMPAGANLTMQCLEHLAAKNSVTLKMRLMNPAQLDLEWEAPAAPRLPRLSLEVDATVDVFAASAPHGQAVPSTL